MSGKSKTAGVLILLLSSAAPAWGVSTYSVTYLGDFVPTAMNVKGEVVGYGIVDSSNISYPVLWSQGKLTNLGSLGGNNQGRTGQALAINDNGDIVGYSLASDGNAHAFLYSNGSMNDLGTMGGIGSEANAINNSGQIAGRFAQQDQIAHVFFGSPGNFTDLGNLGSGYNGPYLLVTAMNAQGNLVITYPPAPDNIGHVYLYSNGELKDIWSLGGGVTGYTAINSSGQIVGSAKLPNGRTHPLLYSAGVTTDLDPNSLAGRAYDINDIGQIVGFSTEKHAFLYENGTMYDLNTLIEPKYRVNLSGATCINNKGQIVAGDLFSGGSVLLTPIPEPSTSILLSLFSIGFLVPWARRKIRLRA